MVESILPQTARRLTTEDRAHLRRLCRRSDLRAVLTLMGDWLVIVAATVISIRLPSSWVYLISVIVISRQINAISELHHHALHMNLFRQRRLNHLLECFYSLPLFTRVSADRAEHLEHHLTYSAAINDHLGWGVGYGLDLARSGSRVYMLWFLLVRPFCGMLQWAALKDILFSPHWRDSSFRRVLLSFWGLLLLGFGIVGRLDVLFWYWLVPFFSFYQIFYFCDDMLGHYNCPRTGTRDMRGLSFQLITGHGTTHHNIHHLFPTIPWFRAGRATQLFVKPEEVDIAYGFWDGVKQMLETRQ